MTVVPVYLLHVIPVRYVADIALIFDNLILVKILIN